MLQIGLTGGMGVGKTTVANLLSIKGAIIISSDLLAAEALQTNTLAYKKTVAAFGTQILLEPEVANSPISRQTLGKLVFSDNKKLQLLNSIVHPIVHQKTQEKLQKISKKAVVVNDIPLLVENSLANNYDIVLVVEAKLELRLQRLQQSRNMDIENILARIANQANDEQRRNIADYVIANNASLGYLQKKVDNFWDMYCQS